MGDGVTTSPLVANLTDVTTEIAAVVLNETTNYIVTTLQVSFSAVKLS
jgi:hypothetical protein